MKAYVIMFGFLLILLFVAAILYSIRIKKNKVKLIYKDFIFLKNEFGISNRDYYDNLADTFIVIGVLIPLYSPPIRNSFPREWILLIIAPIIGVVLLVVLKTFVFLLIKLLSLVWK